MICSAVGICEITDLKREKNSVATSNSPFSYSSMILLADPVGVLEAQRLHAQLDHLDDLRGVLAAELVGALAADAEDFEVLPCRRQRVDLLAREPHDRRVERAAQAALGGADHQQMHLVLAGAGQQPAAPS